MYKCITICFQVIFKSVINKKNWVGDMKDHNRINTNDALIKLCTDQCLFLLVIHLKCSKKKNSEIIEISISDSLYIFLRLV